MDSEIGRIEADWAFQPRRAPSDGRRRKQDERGRRFDEELDESRREEHSGDDDAARAARARTRHRALDGEPGARVDLTA